MTDRPTMERFVNLGVLQREMTRAGLDALVASSPEGSFYLSGFLDDTYLFLRDRLTIVVAYEGRPRTAIVSGIMESAARSMGWIDDVRTYKEHAVSPVSPLADLLEEKGLAKGRIGIEVKWWTVAFYQELLQRLPNATFLPADDVIQRTQSVKTVDEIERLRKAAQLTDEAVFAAWQQSHPGDTEKEVADRMTDEWMKRGAEATSHLTVASGRNTTITHHKASSKKLEAGEIVHSDHGAIFDGFWSDLGRLGVVARPSQHQRDLYKILREIHRAMIDMARPGIEVREFFAFAKRECNRRGIDFSFAENSEIGHSMGQRPGHEAPIVHAYNRAVLEPNMVLALEPMFMTSDEFYHLEDLVLVTENTAQLLSKTGWDTEELFVFE
ncbi:MAG TPA: Xaa-Pro peptidase family protein [bacterium]|nr:Xaa-Pro peptidase family protein [bacterium]